MSGLSVSGVTFCRNSLLLTVVFTQGAHRVPDLQKTTQKIREKTDWGLFYNTRALLIIYYSSPSIHPSPAIQERFRVELVNTIHTHTLSLSLCVFFTLNRYFYPSTHTLSLWHLLDELTARATGFHLWASIVFTE